MPRIKYKPLTRKQENELRQRLGKANTDYYLNLTKLNEANEHIKTLSIQLNKPETDNFLWKLRYDNLLLEIKKLNNRIQEAVEQDK